MSANNTASPAMEAQDVVVCKQGKMILENASFAVWSGKLTGIIGPNGAGKSTLMRALTGEKPNGGRVVVSGEDLYTNPAYWLQQIGYVPAENILHENLKLEDALRYIGHIRLPELSDAEIDARVNQLLIDFDFAENDHRRNRQIDTLSTGERKKANICSELLTDPPILMLDEPTSNLDPNAEYRLMELLAHYAHKYDKTIIVITHTLNTLGSCDEVIFIENSRVAGVGTPDTILALLEEEIEDVDATAPAFIRWSEVFEQYKTERDMTEDSRCKELERAADKRIDSSVYGKSFEIGTWWHQFRWLLKRYARIRANDRRSLIYTLCAGLFCGLLFFVFPNDVFERPFETSTAQLALSHARESAYQLSLSVTILGLILSYTEISKEYHIYKHERLKGLRPSAYFISKWVWLVGMVGIIAPIAIMMMLLLFHRQRFTGFPEPSLGQVVTGWEEFVQFQLVGILTSSTIPFVLATLIMACVASISVGLLISVLAGERSNWGIYYLSAFVVFLVLFSGLGSNPRLRTLIDFFSFVSTGNWAYQGLSSSVGMYCWTGSWRFDEFNSLGHIFSVWFALLLFVLVAGLAAIFILRARDPWYQVTINVKAFILQNSWTLLLTTSMIVMLFSYTVFLRDTSRDFHNLTFSNEFTGAIEYARVSAEIDQLDGVSLWIAESSQSDCGG